MQESEWVNEVFSNLRNLVVCALLIAAGMFQSEHPSTLAVAMGLDLVVGWGMVTIGLLLTILNLLSGLSQLSKRPFPKTSMILLCLVYVALSLRLIAVLVAFRSN
ncbi:hypothetical protein [Luteimonas sp. A482]